MQPITLKRANLTLLERKLMPIRPGQAPGLCFVLIHNPENHLHPYVVAQASDESLANSEWFWGVYHEFMASAYRDYHGRDV